MPDGTIEVQMVALMFAFAPNEVRVPAGRPIRFRLTSADVTHGFMIARHQCQHDAGARLHQPVHDRVPPAPATT